ncbi:dTDP-4-dehydrorhamnose reductase [Psychroflexus sp. YR1-1]|uniref:dTDP-4-dehydrorhamnose reductase n=1 Tax=Psychroflexus aurantiacus TaxID=2709310 RepID=A0A6B3R2Z0_9FLAO|nr:dTDP-4-dehydrorhamnose reductase [Psychroflexus aurantiacus]NEV94398.1 dTDP-4-dehydrorhamnose reductase [Psychroflexus aurantiacus]
MKVLVTGASGQLGKCLQKQSKTTSGIEFLFETSQTLDITSEEALKPYFQEHQPDFCINCAAYTNVEAAEDDKTRAFQVNSEAVKSLARLCKIHQTKLVHVSTDYVFDGLKLSPYVETDSVRPINIYGASKLQGETMVLEHMHSYFILRTSWLYSEFGHNFFNTILKKGEERAELNITTEQIGTPTNANDLAKFILNLIAADSDAFGLYHYSNTGEATWYDFARLILEEKQLEKEVSLKATFSYPTKARRPKFSVMDKSKAEAIFQTQIPHWRESLVGLLKEVNQDLGHRE